MKLFKFDPKKPVETFNWHINALKLCGHWSQKPENEKNTNFLYDLYSWFMVIVFLYLFLLTQIIYLVRAKNLQEFAEGLYFFLTEAVTIPMHICLKLHLDTVKKSIQKLESPKFMAEDPVEDKFVSWAIFRSLFFHRPSIGSCFICIIAWSVTLFLPGSTKYCIVPAVFPFNFESGFGFYLVWIYQIIGTCYSAILYPTFDNLVTGVIFHATAQVNRLGYHLSRIGYDEKEHLNFIVVKVGRKSKNSSNYEKLIECIEHYQEIVAFCNEFSSAFMVAIFIQLSVAFSVICFTLYLVMSVGKGDIRASASVFPYLITIVFQVWQLCYAGNELTHASAIKINAKMIFEIPLETSTFISTMRASYSYFSVMKSVVDK
uniref:Odorant receptor n=1 Tax=Culicoides sonorensis TaxID=179676 RepID=A0A336ME74_CULSO